MISGSVGSKQRFSSRFFCFAALLHVCVCLAVDMAACRRCQSIAVYGLCHAYASSRPYTNGACHPIPSSQKNRKNRLVVMSCLFVEVRVYHACLSTTSSVLPLYRCRNKSPNRLRTRSTGSNDGQKRQRPPCARPSWGRGSWLQPKESPT